MSVERADDPVSAQRLASADRFIEQEEGAAHRLSGGLARALTTALVLTSLLHLYAAFAIVSAPILRIAHVGLMLALLFLTLPVAARFRDRVMPWDWVLAFAAAAIAIYLSWDWDAVADRATEPSTADFVAGATLIVLVLEAVRRSSGWVMPLVVLGFIGYVNEFLIANVFLTDPESKTLAVGLFGLVAGERNNNFGVFAAGAVLAAIPTVVLFQILQRFIVGGLTTGAVKG